MLFHLLLCVGIGDLEVAEVVEHAADPSREPFVAIGEAAADLTLNHRGVVEVIPLGLGEPVGLREGTVRVLNRRDGLLLHGEDAGHLLAKLATRVIELPGGIFLRDDPQAKLPALTDVGALDRVEVARVGIIGDHGADGKLEGASCHLWASSWCLTTEDAAGAGD